MEGKFMLPFPSLVRELIMDHRGRTSRKTGDHILFHSNGVTLMTNATFLLLSCIVMMLLSGIPLTLKPSNVIPFGSSHISPEATYLGSLIEALMIYNSGYSTMTSATVR